MTDHDPQRDPFILDRRSGRCLRARHGVMCIVVAALLLAVFEGASIRHTGERMSPGVKRSVVLAVGEPAGWLADRLPLEDALNGLTGWLSPDDRLDGKGSFVSASQRTPTRGAPSGGTVTFTPDYFDPAALGGKPAQLPRLRTLLVTGDSMAQPLDVELARRLSGRGVKTIRDAHLGSAISSTQVVDWGALASSQVRKQHPDAVVMFLGANEGFPIRGDAGKQIACCGPAWAALYARRVHAMMQTYRRAGAARVYWVLLPLPRDPRRVLIARAVNAAIVAAATPIRVDVRTPDFASAFTPNGFRAAMDVGGTPTIVRRPDGIHLNDAGATVGADIIEPRLKTDFTAIGG